MALKHGKAPSLAFGAGLLGVFLGERVLVPGTSSTTATLLGLAAMLVAVVLGIRQGKGQPGGKILPLLYGLGLLALALHFTRATLPVLLGHRALAESSPRLDGILYALWPALLFASVLPVLFVEFSLASMARAPVRDGRRMHTALTSGLGISCALVFCFAAVFVASELNRKVDLSFFRTSRASNATKQLVAALDQPIEVTLFYPPGNEVLEELAVYFSELARAGSKLTFTTVDQAVDPARAKELGVSGSGVVSIAKGALREQLPIPLKLETARPKLRSLDQDVYKHLAQVARGKRTAYLVQGHDEKTFSPKRDADPSTALSVLRELLTSQNLDVKDLGLAQGLGNEVPSDAALVLLIGPQQAMLAEETGALLRYVKGGGRLLVAVDPEAAKASAPLLDGLSLQLSEAPLANDRFFWARTRQKADRTGIVPTQYSSHPALSAQAAYGNQTPVVMLVAGALDKAAAKAKDDKTADKTAKDETSPSVDLVIRTDGSTWEDKNKNLEFDKDSETRKASAVAAAVTFRATGAAKNAQDGRAFVLGDSDALSDLIIKNRANAYLAFDVVRWLLGEAETQGAPNNESDVPVRHTRKQDSFWFYSSVFMAPALILLAGYVVTRKRRKREVKS
jgi:hypothetical protein